MAYDIWDTLIEGAKAIAAILLVVGTIKILVAVDAAIEQSIDGAMADPWGDVPKVPDEALAERAD